MSFFIELCFAKPSQYTDVIQSLNIILSFAGKNLEATDQNVFLWFQGGTAWVSMYLCTVLPYVDY